MMKIKRYLRKTNGQRMISTGWAVVEQLAKRSPSSAGGTKKMSDDDETSDRVLV
jgi:hypothetical protein